MANLYKTDRSYWGLGDKSGRKQSKVVIPAEAAANKPGVLTFGSVSGTTITDRSLYFGATGNLIYTTGNTFDGTGTQIPLTDTSGYLIPTATASITGANGTAAVPLLFVGVISSAVTDATIFTALGYKVQIIDAWAVATASNSTYTWKLTDGTNDITTTVAFASTDKEIKRAVSIDDAYHVVAAAGALHLITSNSAARCICYVYGVKIT